MKVFLIILVIALIAVVFYLWKKKNQVITVSKTVIKPRPNPSWTNADWLANGYTQAEIDNYKKGDSIVQNVLSQLNF